MIDYTSTANIASIQRRAMLPDSQSLYPAEDIVKIMSEELKSDIVPLLMSVREDYFLHDDDQAIDTAVNAYEIPERAIGNKLKDAVLVNSNDQEISLPRVDLDSLKHNQWNGLYPLNWPGFCFKDEQIFIYPNTSSIGSYTLRQKFFRRPNNIVETTDAGQVTIINTVTKTVTLTNFPSTWAVTTIFDVIKGTPSFKAREDDVTPTAIDATAKTLTFATLPTDVAVGDWFAEQGESPIAQIPYDVFPLLEQRATLKILEGLKDSSGLQMAADVYQDMVKKFMDLVTPRADGSPKKIVRSANSIFGGGFRRAGWW